MEQRKRAISSFSVIIVFIAMALLGFSLAPRLAVRLAPSDVLPSITVSFSMDGSARTVESEVTSRLESMLARIAGVAHIKSRSSSNSGYVTLQFDKNTDMEIARFEVAMAVRQFRSDMPESASYPVITMQPVDDDASRPFMSYTINADEPPSDLMRYAEDYIKPVLSVIKGVDKVEFSGATPKEWQVTYDVDVLSSSGIGEREIAAGLMRRGEREFIDKGLFISSGINSDSLVLSDIIAGVSDGRIITLDKIATATLTDATPRRYYRINGLNSLYMNITATPDANQLLLSDKIKDALGSLMKDLPSGYMIDLSYDSSERIRTELENIYTRTALTVIILLLFVAIITFSFRYLLLITISLFLNLSIAFAFYYLFDVEIQLYSLAGITISLNLIIDNIIVMTEHITRRHNLRSFTAVLAATLTTVGALSIVFFLDERSMLGLKDFVNVVLINLIISLFVALFLVPALVEKLHLKSVSKVRSSAEGRFLSRLRTVNIKTHRIKLRLRSFEFRIFGWLNRYRVGVVIAFILLFGLPVFLLPDKMEGSGPGAKIYNATLGSTTYNEKIKPWTDMMLGGTLRIFVEKVYNGNYYNRDLDEPVLYINATLPNGATLEQMNRLIARMEQFLGSQTKVRQFQTYVYGPRRASIAVYFKTDAQRDGYPYKLKSEVISKALTLGGGSWSVYGLEDMGFNNDVRETAGSSRIKMTGYNYDDLMNYAMELRDSLLNNRRIREVNLSSEFTWWKDDYTEFFLKIDKDLMARHGLTVKQLYDALEQETGRDIPGGKLSGENGMEEIRLFSSAHDRDVWSFMRVPLKIDGRYYKLEDFATIEQRQSPQDIIKEDQEYTICLQYEYIGSSTLAQKVLERMTSMFNSRLPMGYKAHAQTGYQWNRDDNRKQYFLILFVVVIIFFISSILFNSLRQPLAIIFVIPVSFIGVFLTFYVFKLKFDQGAFAAFILLSGLTVNAAIYIINEFNDLRCSHPSVSPLRCYLSAFNFKIRAVLLTVLSTVLGFIPFLIGDTQLSFWFPLAAGTMGGLLFSLLAIVLCLPAVIPKPF